MSGSAARPTPSLTRSRIVSASQPLWVLYGMIDARRAWRTAPRSVPIPDRRPREPPPAFGAAAAAFCALIAGPIPSTVRAAAVRTSVLI